MNRNMRRGPGFATGPLVTNHIRNLNQELEMLQRRRELLQNEQDHLCNEVMYTRKRPYENDQPPLNFAYAQQQSTVQNFAHLYNNGPGPSFDRDLPPHIKKRHAVNVWDDDRFNVNQNPVPPRFGSYGNPNPLRMVPLKPLMDVVPKPSIGRRISGQIPPRPRREFMPNKVTKPKVKLNTAKPTLGTVPPKKKGPQSAYDKNPTDQMLLADQVPSQQVAGRLELALGAILKEVRGNCCKKEESTNLFNNRHVQRSLKQSIRERLRTVMMNKVVGRFVDIVATYRRTYPASTDQEMLDNAILVADSEHAIQPTFNKILTKKLNEIFVKLQKLSKGKDEEILKIIESRPMPTAGDDPEVNENRALKAKSFYSSLVDTLLEERIPKLLPNYTQQIIKIFEDSKKSSTTDNKEQNHTLEQTSETQSEKPVTNDIHEAQAEDNAKDDDMTAQLPDANKETLHGEVAQEIASNKCTDKTYDVEMSQIEDSSKHEETAQLDEPEVLNESLKSDKPNEITINENDSPKPAEAVNDKTNISMMSPVSQSKSVQQYFVKVLGQPNLPNRVDAYKFLNQFNAVSIKKHKVVQNLLVVGFNDEKDFNSALAANGSIIGNSTLTIKANDKQLLNTTLSPKENKTDNYMIPQDLENQISDLLTTISKADEEMNESPVKTEKSSQDDVSDSTLNKSENLNKEIKQEVKQEVSDVLDKSELLKSSVNNDKNDDAKEEKIQADNNTAKNMSDENSRGLEIIREDEDGKSSEEASGAVESQSSGDKNIKNNIKDAGKATPSKARQSITATPRTLRTRSASRLIHNN
ncbi:uncharacterized protein [Battus philenor]|uniref:uncharacterized protein n=1 Tax=Battus philenor TaxID=42288 RepID=UPI0035CFA81C